MNLSELAARGAEIIHRGFDDYHHRFRALTRRAVRRFEERDWQGIQNDTVERIDLYNACIAETLEVLRGEVGQQAHQRSLWTEMKRGYSRVILGRDDFELAQTFFNSLTRRVFTHQGLDRNIDYLSRDFPLPYKGWEMANARMYGVRRINPSIVERVLEDAGFRVPFRSLEEDALLSARAMEQAIVEQLGGPELEALDVLEPIFVRSKAAYIVGRVRRGTENVPLVLAIVNEEDGLVVDAVLATEDEVSIVFSFARWYFHADVESPRQVIGFLHSILPRKRIAELYISLGYHKHGKTELFSDLTSYIADTEELFVVAPGRPGQVMCVFTLPRYEFVFKVIRDSFPASKKTTPQRVREKYRQVFLHDRVGRLVDFLEFVRLQFPRRRFSPALLEELLSSASHSVSPEGDEVFIRHMYVGRRVVPMDVFLQQAPAEEAEAAVIDWGHAIKELAAVNIFAGDMLLKNFGVTRHGRVVFYDYDELCPLTDCNFRRLPPPTTEEDELAAEPWFAVRENDVFPEEIRTFLGLDAEMERAFLREHAELFEVEFWRELQERHLRGEIIGFFPYTDARRLRSSESRALAAARP